METVAISQSGKNLIRSFFLVLMAVQAVLEALIGLSLLFNFEQTLKVGFGVTYTKEWDVVGVALGLYLLLLTTLILLSIYWVRKENYAGIILSFIIGAFLTLFGIVSLIKLGNPQGLMIDSVRGVLTILLAHRIGKNLPS